VSGGAGSVEDKGMGSGTERIVKRRSWDERGSIGKINERVERIVVRTGEKRARREVRRILPYGVSSKRFFMSRHPYLWSATSFCWVSTKEVSSLCNLCADTSLSLRS
jgi:hypothetical protein